MSFKQSSRKFHLSKMFRNVHVYLHMVFLGSNQYINKYVRDFYSISCVPNTLRNKQKIGACLKDQIMCL